MGKATKRERKFKASGGVEGRIDKGVIAGKRKTGRKKRGPAKHPKQQHRPSSVGKLPAEEATTKATTERPDDFLGEKNLGDLDVDSFFEQFSQVVAEEKGELGVKIVDDQEDATKDFNDSEHVVQAGSTPDSEGSSEESSGEDGDEDQIDANAVEKNDKLIKATSKRIATSAGKPVSALSASDASSTTSSDSDDDEDDEGAVAAAEAHMKSEIAGLQDADPEFHAFLKENEQSLLDFNQDDDDEEMPAAGDADGAAGEPKGGAATAARGIVLTPDVLSKLQRGAFVSHSVKSLRHLVAAYRSACHSSDEDAAEKVGESGGTLYVIESSNMFDKLLLLCLTRVHEAFRHHLLGVADRGGDIVKEEEEDGSTEKLETLDPRKLESSKRWPEVQPILRSYLLSTLHALERFKEPALLTMIHKALEDCVPLSTPLPRVAEALLKQLVQLWSAPLDSSADYQVVRLHAFFRIRQMALTQPFPFVEAVLKKTYLAYAKRAKFGTTASAAVAWPTLTFMGNCLVELYSLDHHSSYQHAFVYIRQLALHLRAVLQKKTPESFQQVFCWQYLHCLKLWVAVLSRAAAATEDSSLMRSLIYPVTEIVMGTCRLAPSPVRHLPLRFHCVRLLQQLAAASTTFIPTTSLLLEVLDWKEWGLVPKKTARGSARSQVMLHLIKLPKDDPLRFHEQLESAMADFFVLLEREVELYRYSAGFPEFRVAVVQRLRKFVKQCRNPRWKAYGRATVETCEKYAAAATDARVRLHEAPKDVKRLECLLPASAPTMRERHELSVQKEAKRMEASQPSTVAKNATEGTKDDGTKIDKAAAHGRASKKRRRQKSSTAATASAINVVPDNDVFAQKDDVKEGIEWSDED